MSGFKVNFSVNNQLATPSIHAAAFVNRPPAGQPGRLFVDTDNPSTGIYRDTGIVWENITGGAGGSNLQTVTDAGNTTDNNILLTYPNNTLANALVFYNDQLAQEEYLIEKRGTGITTNDSLAIQSRGNISPSTNPVGFLIDGANDVIKTFYTTSYTEQGLKLDFANNSYVLGDWNDVALGTRVELGDKWINILSQKSGLSSATAIYVDGQNEFISSQYNAIDIGIKLDFAGSAYSLGNADQGLFIFLNTNRYYFGDVGSINNNTSLILDDGINLIKTVNQGNDIGLKLDFANNTFILGNPNVLAGLAGGIKVDTNNNATTIGDFNLSNNGTTFFIDDNNGIIKSTYFYSDRGLKLDFANSVFNLGDYNAVVNGTFLAIDDTNQRLEVSGNLASGTAGGNSGQHLKIRVGGVDYKITLLNP